MMRDRYGLDLTAGSAAAAHYQDGIDRLLRLDADPLESLEAAVAADPGFALGHAAIALLAAEDGDCARSVIELRRAADTSPDATPRERSAIAAIAAVCGGDQSAAFAALRRHLAEHPTDALLLNVAFPTIAFSGVTETSAAVWSLVEDAAPSYGDDWWYLSLLAFVRQEQERYDEAMTLAQRALELDPFAGHAVHAAAHVYYETAEHAAGLSWIDEWSAGSPATSSAFRSHVAWHAGLFELSLGELALVQKRWHTQLAPPESRGLRVLVDAGSMLHRCQMRGMWTTDLPTARVLDAAGRLAYEPPSAFAALHAGLAWAVARDAVALQALSAYAVRFTAAAEVLCPVLDGLSAQVEGRHDDAVALLDLALPRLELLGGSLAQRGAVEEALLRSLLDAGRLDEARERLTATLDAGRTVHWLPVELSGAALPG